MSELRIGDTPEETQAALEARGDIDEGTRRRIGDNMIDHAFDTGLSEEEEAQLLAEKLGLHSEVGWTGAFSRREAPGAWANGTRVEKTAWSPGEVNAIGVRGTVLGSLGPIPFDEEGDVFGYFLEWDSAPRVAVFCTENKLKVVDGGAG